MNTTFVQDIAIIANHLNGKIEFSNIKFNQKLLDEEYREKSVNNIVFVMRMHGLYFYTTLSAMESMIKLGGKEMPVLVGCDNSLNLYEITK